VSAHNPTAPPQTQLNTRDVSAHKHPAPPQTKLNSLRAPSLMQPVSLLKPIRTSRGETAAALRLIHGLQHHHPRAPAENRRVKTTSSSSAISNGHHLDPRRLFTGRSVKKFWCPTSHSALRLLREGALGVLSHIIIHTGTNDLSTRRVDITKALSNVERTASRIYPRAKVIISSLLPRRDMPQRIINAINVEIANICSPIPNVHIANHQQVTHQHLYDHIHIHREGMRP